MKKLIYFLALTSFAWTSCEKTLDLNIQAGEPKIAVDARIQRVIDPVTGQETGYPPLVILTKTLDVFGSLDSAALSNFFIHNAVVKISDGTKTTTLKEYNLQNTPIPGMENAYFYSIDTANLSNMMVGEFNKTYTMTIDWNGKTYTSTTTINTPVPVDSFWTQEAKETGIDSPYLDLRIQYTDPAAKGNYNYFKLNSKFKTGNTKTTDDYFTDEVTNGITLKFTIRSGGQRGHFFEGDTANIEWSSVPFSAYSFFNTKRFSTQAVGNPFATPVAVTGNISNGGLGAFIGYGTINYNIIIKK